MKWIEKGWYQFSFFNYLLAPLSLLFYFISSIRRLLFRVGIKKQYQSPTPIIVVGNITVGGTGKTPFVIYLVEMLRAKGLNPGIVSRGYGAEVNLAYPFPREVTPETPVDLSGDEPKLLATRTSCPVVIDPNRVAAAQYIQQHFDVDVIISDDGLQHYQLGRMVEIVLLDAERMLGNGWLLPVGPLRELPNRLQTVDITISNAGVSDDENKDFRLFTDSPYHLTESNKTLQPGTDVNLVSGIGNPNRFLNSAKAYGLNINDCHWFADHHPFSESDFANFSEKQVVLITEKDAVKIKSLELQCNIYVLPIAAKLSNKIESELNELICSKLLK